MKHFPAYDELLPSEDELGKLKKQANIVIKALQEEFRKEKIKADVFLGGSFAKGTLLKQENYDIDIFARFPKDASNEKLEKAAEKTAKTLRLKVERIHGSRDYFQIRQDKVIYEIVPVIKINRPRDMENVTDLSYFHVSYVKRKLRKKLAYEIALAKAFCHAQGVYGAESYIKGFSGYALECLIIHYDSFLKFLKAMEKASIPTIIDSEKHYSSRGDAIRSMNESRLRSPIIVVDPTWKERNVTAALSLESFNKFKKAASAFLKNPSRKLFERKEINPAKLEAEAKRQKAELLHLALTTSRQAGDIAGTKLKKAADFIMHELEKRFSIKKYLFSYSEGQEADIYYILKEKEVMQMGPPIGMKKHALAFKKIHKHTFVKKGRLYAKLAYLSPKDYLRERVSDEMMKQIGINIWKII